MLSGPEVFRPLPVKVKFRPEAVGPALSLVARSCAESLPGGLGGLGLPFGAWHASMARVMGLHAARLRPLFLQGRSLGLSALPLPAWGLMSRWACWLCGSPCATNAARMVAI